MASIRSLPTEVFELVVDAMEASHDEQGIAALAMTCSAFYTLVIPRLYNQDTLWRHSELIFWAAHYGRLSTAKRFIAAGVDFRNAADFLVPLPEFINALKSKTPREACHGMFRSAHLYARCGHDDIDRTAWTPLHHAIVNGDMDMVKFLVEAGASVNAPSIEACHCTDKLLHEEPRGYWFGNYQKRRPLHTAICYGQIHIAKYLLQNGASIETSERNTALHEAAERGHSELVSFILDNGYNDDIHQLDGMKLSPIWRAYLNDQWEALDLLISRGANIDDDVGYGYTMLIDACVFNSFARASYLVDRGANVNVTCLAFPTTVDTSLLRRAGDDLRVRPIDICCWRQCEKALPWRQSLGRDLSGTEHEHLGREDGARGQLVSKLLAAGANTDACGKTHDSVPPLVAAAVEHLSDVVEALVEGGAPVDLPDKCGVTPLAAAFAYPYSSCRDHSKVPGYHECGTQWDKKNTYSDLADSETESDDEMGSDGPDQEGQDSDGWNFGQSDSEHPDDDESHQDNSEDEATENENDEAENDLDTNMTDSEGENPEARVPERDRKKLECSELLKCVKILVSNGADVNRADKTGNTPFMRLCTAAPFRRYLGMDEEDQQINWYMHHADKPRMASLLVAHGADRGAKLVPASMFGEEAVQEWEKYGQPTIALHHAFWDGNIELCKILCADGEVEEDTMFWLFEFAWQKIGEEDLHTPINQMLLDETYEFLKGLPVSAESSAAKKLGCLAIALRAGDLDSAQDILDEGLTLSELQTQVPGKRWAYGKERVELGTICLREAVAIRHRARSITKRLLELGANPFLPSILLLAVHKRDVETVALLAKYKVEFNIKDDVTGQEHDKYHENRMALDEVDNDWIGGCVNPLRLAIKRGNVGCIEAMLANSPNHIDPWFRCYYLREACSRLRPPVVVCLLEHASMHVGEADLPVAPDDTVMDLPLIYLLQNVEKICALAYLSENHNRVDITSRLERIGWWIACLAAFAKAGVDLGLKDKTGKSGLDYLADHIVYTGKDRFRTHLAKQLRVTAGIGAPVTPEDKDRKETFASMCYELLASPDVYNISSVRGSEPWQMEEDSEGLVWG
ncbi:hypothetical protein QBC44DRAFT_118006 [Cladorrhinum sp. PSN332]|nr:hypothetical protein QBC44DRAFT_118006 [Cladorrhinum sp. PSN332]